jgi:hypothetical protein
VGVGVGWVGVGVGVGGGGVGWVGVGVGWVGVGRCWLGGIARATGRWLGFWSTFPVWVLYYAAISVANAVVRTLFDMATNMTLEEIINDNWAGAIVARFSNDQYDWWKGINDLERDNVLQRREVKEAIDARKWGFEEAGRVLKRARIEVCLCKVHAVNRYNVYEATHLLLRYPKLLVIKARLYAFLDIPVPEAFKKMLQAKRCMTQYPYNESK